MSTEEQLDLMNRTGPNLEKMHGMPEWDPSPKDLDYYQNQLSSLVECIKSIPSLHGYDVEPQVISILETRQRIVAFKIRPAAACSSQPTYVIRSEDIGYDSGIMLDQKLRQLCNL